MGNRVSISFKNDEEESVVLFSHWQGMMLVRDAKEYVKNLINKKKKTHISNPRDRLEPDTVIVDFIRHITKNMEIVESDLYLRKNKYEGDNSDNGHHIIDLREMKEQNE